MTVIFQRAARVYSLQLRHDGEWCGWSLKLSYITTDSRERGRRGWRRLSIWKALRWWLYARTFPQRCFGIARRNPRHLRRRGIRFVEPRGCA